MAQITQRFFLKSTRMITAQVCHLVLEREDKSLIPFTAGQFITMHIEGPTKILHRSYSVANAPNKHTLEIACALVEGGVASQFLSSMRPGDSLLASGPYGLFVLKDEQPSRYVLIATGTGVTPYRSMLNDLQDRLLHMHPTLKVVLILGVRNRSELLFADEFNAFAATHPNFSFYACYSQENPIDPKPFEQYGRVQATLSTLNLEPNNDIVYLCGNPNMIDDNFALLTELGFDRKSVRREKYVFSH